MIEKIKSWFATWKQQREYKKEVARLKKLAKKKYGEDYEWYYQRASFLSKYTKGINTREADNSMDILTYMLLVDMLDVNLAGNTTSISSSISSSSNSSSECCSSKSSRYDDSDSYNSSSSYSSGYDSGSSSSSSSYD